MSVHTSSNIGRPIVRTENVWTNADTGAVSKLIDGSVFWIANTMVRDLYEVSFLECSFATALRTTVRWEGEKAMTPEPKAAAGMSPDLA